MVNGWAAGRMRTMRLRTAEVHVAAVVAVILDSIWRGQILRLYMSSRSDGGRHMRSIGLVLRDKG